MFSVKLFLLALVGILVYHWQGAAAVPTVAVTDGPMVELTGGGMLTGITIQYDEPDFLKVNKSIDAFLGVPFAHPPVGGRRFQDPQAFEIVGEYNATEDRDECPQTSPFESLPGPIPSRKISEDCLYLSIYVPAQESTSPVPVLVWIHGGGYSIGGGSEIIYEPLPIVALADIIVVNVNYRLGVFGFMTTGDDVAAGNYGMKDQVLALQWVQDNIASFRGDPNRVTISGESAGGSSVSLHSLSPLSTGLFQQSIMQSGNAACLWSWTTMDQAAAAHRKLAEAVDCPTTSSQQMVDCLREVDEDELTRTQILLGDGGLSSPVVDGVGPTRFLPDKPTEMIKRQQFQVLPALIGSNEDESAFNFAFIDLPESLITPPVVNISMFRAMLPFMSFYTTSPTELAAVEQHYIDWAIADNTSASQLDGLIRLGTDQTFACPTEHYARTLEAAGASVYRYEMTHDPSWSVYVGIPKWTGAAHAEDLQYVFAWGLNPTIDGIVGQTDEEKFMSIEFMRYWTNFVKSGNPNEPMTSDQYPEWPLYTMPDQQYKKLSLEMDNDRAMRAASCSFWLNYMPGLHIQTAPLDELYEDWQEQYGRWKNMYMPEWSQVFEEYKENTCPTPTPAP